MYICGQTKIHWKTHPPEISPAFVAVSGLISLGDMDSFVPFHPKFISFCWCCCYMLCICTLFGVAAGRRPFNEFKFILSCANNTTPLAFFINHLKIPISDKEVISLFCLAFFFMMFPSETERRDKKKGKKITHTENEHTAKHFIWGVVILHCAVGHKRNAIICIYYYIRTKEARRNIVSYFELMFYTIIYCIYICIQYSCG